MFRLGIEEGQTGAFVAKNTLRGSYVVRGVASMLMYQAEPGVSCPLTMTAAAIPCLRAGNTNSNKLIDEWVNKLETPVYVLEDLGNLLTCIHTHTHSGTTDVMYQCPRRPASLWACR